MRSSLRRQSTGHGVGGSRRLTDTVWRKQVGGMFVRNVDYPERFIRIVVGLVFGNLGFANPGWTWLAGTGMLQVAAVGAGLYLFFTGLVGFCPLYALLFALRRRREPGGR